MPASTDHITRTSNPSQKRFSVAKKNLGGRNWDVIESLFQEKERLISTLSLPSPEELELYKLHLISYGQIPDNQYLKKIQHGYSVHIEGAEKYRTLVEIFNVLGLPIERKSDIWDYAVLAEAGIFNKMDTRTIIARAIQQKSITPEFELAWGEYNYFAGLLVGLTHQDNYADSLHERNINGFVSNTTILQRHWYAHWIKANSSDFSKERRKAEEAFAEFLYSISIDHIEPYSPYPKEWYCTMLEVDKEQSKKRQDAKKEKGPFAAAKVPQAYAPVLISSYVNMTKDEVDSLLSHPVITPAILPPLSPAAFSPTKK